MLMRRSIPCDTKALGEISPFCVYPLEVLKARCGWGAEAWRAAKRRGLKAVRIGPRLFVRGKDFCALVDRLLDGEEQP